MTATRKHSCIELEWPITLSQQQRYYSCIILFPIHFCVETLSIYLKHDPKQKLSHRNTLRHSQIYDPLYNDRVYYSENEISDNDENSILTHGTTCPPNASGQFAYAMDCRQFLNCWNGRGAIQSCAPGTLFNPRSLECDHPSKVKCKSFDEYAKPTAASAAYTLQNSDGRDHGASALTSGYYNDRVRIECQSDFSGLMAHPTDCTKFLNCDHGKTVIQDCGPGTAFNAITKVCDWPQNVDCGSRSLSGGSDAHAGEEKMDVRFTEQNMASGGRYAGTGNGGAGYGSAGYTGNQNYQQNGYTRQGK